MKTIEPNTLTIKGGENNHSLVGLSRVTVSSMNGQQRVYRHLPVWLECWNPGRSLVMASLYYKKASL
jgi:hypothetical protein